MKRLGRYKEVGIPTGQLNNLGNITFCFPTMDKGIPMMKLIDQNFYCFFLLKRRWRKWTNATKL